MPPFSPWGTAPGTLSKPWPRTGSPWRRLPFNSAFASSTPRPSSTAGASATPGWRRGSAPPTTGWLPRRARDLQRRDVQFTRAKGFDTFSEGLRAITEIFHALKAVLKKRGLSTAVGDEGGFAPALSSVEDALEAILAATNDAGYEAGQQIFLALDVASSEFFVAEKDRYVFKKSTQDELTAAELVAFYDELTGKYPIVSIEDGCDENDWAGWKALTDRIGDRVQLVGDDLFVTNVKFLQRGIDEGVANSILVKVNQIGSLTETLGAIRLAQENNYTTVISHRSGETEDATIADLAVATNAGQIKTGSLSRSDRTAKYNQLLRIEQELGANAVYGGKA